MATIPTVQREIMPQVESSLRLDPGATARQFNVDVTRGGGDDGIARGLQNLASGVLHLAQVREQADLTRRVNEYQEGLQIYLSDEKEGVLRTTPEDLANGLTERSDEYFIKRREQLGKGLSRNMHARFMAATDGITLNARQSVMNHESAEMEKYRTTQINQSIQTTGMRLAENPFDADFEKNELDGVLNDLQMQVASLPPDVAKKRIDDALKQTFVVKVQRMWDINPKQARAALEEAKDMFSEDEYQLLMTDTNNKVVPAEAEDKAKSFIDEKGYRTSFGEWREYVEKNISPEHQDMYMQKYSEEAKVRDIEYQQDKGQRINDFIATLNTGNYGASKAALGPLKRFLDENMDSETSRGLQGMFDAQFRPKGPAGFTGKQKDAMMFHFLGALQEAREAGTPYTSLQDFWGTYFSEEGALYGTVPDEFSSQVMRAWSLYEKGNKSGGGSDSGYLNVGVFTSEKNQKLENMITDTGQRAYYENQLSEEQRQLDPDGKWTSKQTYEWFLTRITERKLVEASMPSIFRRDKTGKMYVPAASVESYIRTLEKKTNIPITYQESTGLFLTPAGAEGDVYYYDPNYKPDIKITPPAKSAGKNLRQAAANRIETSEALIEIAKKMSGTK